MRIMSAFTTAFFVSRIPLLPDSALTAQRSSEDVRFMHVTRHTAMHTAGGGSLCVVVLDVALGIDVFRALRAALRP